jgi:hypothetical protein
LSLTMDAEIAAKKNGHPPVAEGVVCVDFDGTIAPWGDLFGFPEPLPGAKGFLQSLQDAGYTIVIFTSRLSTVWHSHEGRDVTEGILAQVEYLQEYFRRYELPADSITAEKIPALAYIDDKAIEFIDWGSAGLRFIEREVDRA